MSTTGRRAATETGPVNGIRSPLNVSIKLILYAWASSNIHHQLNLWAFFLVLQQIMSSTLLPCSSPPRLLLRCSVSTPSTQQSLPSPIPWLLLLPVGSEDYYSTPTPPWLSSYYSKGFLFFFESKFYLGVVC